MSETGGIAQGALAFDLEDEFTLVAMRDELRNPRSPAHVESAMQTIFKILGKHYEDDTFKDEMVSIRFIEDIVNTTRRSTVSPYLLHRAGSIFSELVSGSTERSTEFIVRGGLDRSLEIMESPVSSDAFLMTTYTGIMAQIIVPSEERASFVGRIFENVVKVLELHREEVLLYYCGCEALGSCTGPDFNVSQQLQHRAVQCIFDGILTHKNEEDAQSVGRGLLVEVIGQENAMRMIDHAEMHHCEDADYSCAA